MNLGKKVEKYRIELRKKQIKEKIFQIRKKLSKNHLTYSETKLEEVLKNLSLYNKKKKSILPPLKNLRKMTIAKNFKIPQKFLTTNLIFLFEEIFQENKQNLEILEELTWILINFFYQSNFLEKFYKDFIITFNSIILNSNFVIVSNIIGCLNNILDFPDSVDYVFKNFEIEKLKDIIFLDKILNPKLGMEIVEFVYFIFKKKKFFGNLEKIHKFFDIVVLIFDVFVNKYYNSRNLEIFMKFFAFFFQIKEVQNYRSLVEEFIANDNFENFFEFIEISIDNNLKGIKNLLIFFDIFTSEILNEDFRVNFFLKYKKELESFVNFFNYKKNKILPNLINFFSNLIQLHSSKNKNLNIPEFFKKTGILIKIEDLIFEKNQFCLKQSLDFLDDFLLILKPEEIHIFFKTRNNLIETFFELLTHENGEISKLCFNIIRVSVENHKNYDEFLFLIKSNSRFQGDLEEFEKIGGLDEEDRGFVDLIKYDERIEN